MLAFLDFEASSLGKRSYPIEVAWVFENGASEAYLIRPAPDWTDWDEQAAVIHHITRKTLIEQGVPHQDVANRMIARLSDHDLVASAPSWDGKWMSALLRAAGLPRHSLRLRNSDEALRDCAEAILAPVVAAASRTTTIADLIALTKVRSASRPAAHRALPDAEEERQRWLAVRAAAEAMAQAAHG